MDTYYDCATARNTNSPVEEHHDCEWWAKEAARAGNDLPGVISAAISMLTVAGLIGPEAATLSELATPDTGGPEAAPPSWREAAIEYHKSRGDRQAVIEIDPERLARLRRLLPKEVSLERAYHELSRQGEAAQSTVDALVF